MKHALALIAIVLALAACGSPTTNTGTVVGTTATSVPTATPIPTVASHFTVGQTVNVSNLDIVTVNSVKTEAGEQYSTPTSGNHYLLIDISIKNVSTAEQVLSLANYTFRDASGQSYSQVYINARNSPWGKIESGGIVRGQLAYEVPLSQKSFTLAFQSDLTSPGQTIWDISV